MAYQDLDAMVRNIILAHGKLRDEMNSRAHKPGQILRWTCRHVCKTECTKTDTNKQKKAKHRHMHLLLGGAIHMYTNADRHSSAHKDGHNVCIKIMDCESGTATHEHRAKPSQRLRFPKQSKKGERKIGWSSNHLLLHADCSESCSRRQPNKCPARYLWRRLIQRCASRTRCTGTWKRERMLHSTQEVLVPARTRRIPGSRPLHLLYGSLPRLNHTGPW